MVHVEDSLYSKIKANVPIICVDLVIKNQDKVLLVYRAGGAFSDQWWVPGGRVYKNENLHSAAIRKASEETGLKIKIIKKLDSYEAFEKSTDTHTVAIGFLVEAVNRDVNLDKTSKEFRWVDKDELTNLTPSILPYVLEIIKDSGVFS